MNESNANYTGRSQRIAVTLRKLKPGAENGVDVADSDGFPADDEASTDSYAITGSPSSAGQERATTEQVRELSDVRTVS